MVGRDLLPALSQAITATDVVAAGIGIPMRGPNNDPEAQSAGAVTDVPDAIA